jgi:hypothetical protein
VVAVMAALNVVNIELKNFSRTQRNHF